MTNSTNKTKRVREWQEILANIADLNDDADYKQQNPVIDKCLEEYKNQEDGLDTNQDVGRVAKSIGKDEINF